MKPLTTATLDIRISGLDNANVDKIDFLFKAANDRYSKTLACKTYTKDSTDVTCDGADVYKLSFDPDETDKFPNGLTAWLDIRPVMKDGSVVPVRILNFTVTPTLFTRGDINDS